MRPAPLSFWQEIAFPDEFFQAQLHGARPAYRERHDLGEGEAFVIGEKGDDLFRQGVFLFHGGAENEQEPSFPVGLG